MDPVEHWHRWGWAERRRPNTWFDTAFYLGTYPDIAEAGIDPLLHYARFGHAEGRLAAAAGAIRRATLARAHQAAAHPTGYDTPAGAPHLDATALATRLVHAMEHGSGKIGLLVAASHDRYIDIAGGIQLVLADEQATCAAAGTTHLHFAPAIARPLLADDAPPSPLQATVDGAFAGLIAEGDAVAALALVAEALPQRPRRFALHSPLGHRTQTLAALAAACGPDAVFWLHDHVSLCEGYNLLRNDLDACNAPPEASMACRICVHGPTRPRHRARLRALFGAATFHVLAPSRTTLDFWLARAELPFASARVSEPATLVAHAPEPVPARDQAAPLRTAFVGYPLAHKGWNLFQDLVTAAAHAPPGTAPYALYHFATENTLVPMDAVTSVTLRVDAAHRDAATEALKRHAIEAVIVAAPWPETFSFVAHEALAAGAHVLTLAASGNVAAMASRHPAVHVFETAGALARHITGGEARTQIRAAPRPAPLALVPGQGSLPLLESLLEPTT